MGKLYIKDVLAVAAGEIGYLEKASNQELDKPTANAGAGNWTKYARDLWAAQPHFYQGCKNGFDWCTVFVDWCLYMAAGKDALRAMEALCYTGPYGASCTYSVGYYKAAGRFHSSNPQPGDQIFFGSAGNIRHTGLVEKVEGGVVTTIEGNSNNAVRRREYALTNQDIFGYGRPGYDGWEAPAEPEPEPKPALPTRFNDVPAGRFFTEAVIWAVDNGITKGTTDTTFSPFDGCTRAEVVTFLYRAAKYMEQRTAEMIRETVTELRAELGGGSNAT